MDKSLEQFRERLKYLEAEYGAEVMSCLGRKPENVSAEGKIGLPELTEGITTEVIALMKEYKVGFVDEDKELPENELHDLSFGNYGIATLHHLAHMGLIYYDAQSDMSKAGWKYVEMI